MLLSFPDWYSFIVVLIVSLIQQQTSFKPAYYLQFIIVDLYYN